MYDGWRVFWRNRRKQLGLPASADVGALSRVVVPLRGRAEARLGVPITAAAASVPHLAALYQDDVHDVLDYAGIASMALPAYYNDYYRPLLFETAAGYAGHGLGLGAARPPQRNVLSVHRAPNALTLALAALAAPFWLFEPGYRHAENFTLGADRERDANPAAYRKELRAAVEAFLCDQVGAYLPADTVIFLGASAPAGEDEPFARLVLDTLAKKQQQAPDVHLKDAVFAAARGTAEMVRRNGQLADARARVVGAQDDSKTMTSARADACSGNQPCKEFL